MRIATALVLGMSTMTFGLNAVAATGVNGYLAEGYEIAGKTAEQKLLPGKPPYEAMQRAVLITKYDLRATGAPNVICIVTYDSQQDTIDTECR